MEWTETPESSNLLRFGYETTTQVLTVEFKNGGVYDYFDVSDSVHEEMKAAASKGQFLAKSIKTRFRYARH
jgi:hypothetical protein